MLPYQCSELNQLKSRNKVNLTSHRRHWISLVLLLFLAGCDGQSWNNPYPVQERFENILYSSFDERPNHLDPARSYASNEAVFTGQIYEPPLQYHYLKRPYELIPLTASQMPKPVYIGKNGKRLPANAPVKKIAYTLYDIKIQKGIRFQPHPAFVKNADGEFLYHELSEQQLIKIYKLSDFQQADSRELTAADYVYQIKRLAHPKLHSPIFGLMSAYITGLKPYASKLKKAADKMEGYYLDLNKHNFAGAKVINKHTYRIKIKGKYPQMMYWLTMPFFAPVPWEADRFYSQPGLEEKNITLDWYPVGTGPYMLTVNNPNLQMVLEKNPNFHGETYPSEGMHGDQESGLLADAGKVLPFIDKVVYTLEKENIPYWNKFLQGYYDVSGISSDSFDQAINIGAGGEAELTDEMKEKGIQLKTGVATSMYYFGFNMLDPVVGGKNKSARKLRHAISIALDYEEFISIFLNGRGIAAQGPIAPGIFGYRSGKEGMNPVVYKWVNGKLKRRDIAEAKKLLAEAGYPGGVSKKTGKPLLLYFDTTGSGPDSKARFDWMRKQFKKINIQLVVRNTTYNRFQDKMLKGTSQMFMWGWNADYPDPENFLFLLYGPNKKAKLNGENAVNYSNKKFDRLFIKMKDMSNGPKRQKVIDSMVEIVRKDAPWIWGFNPKSFALSHKWYGNSKPNFMANNTLKYKKVDPVLRYQKRQAWNKPVLWPIIVLVIVMIAVIIPAIFIFIRKEHTSSRGGEASNA